MRRKIYLILSIVLLAGAAAILGSERVRGGFDLASRYFFGQGSEPLTAQERAIFAVDDAASFGEDPEDRVRYRLVDAHTGNGERVGAVIEALGEQAFYREGDQLPGSPVRLAWVLEDAVLLERNGSFRLLWRQGPGDQGEHFTVPGSGPLRPVGHERALEPRVVDFRGDPAVSRLADNYRERLYRNPLSLVGAINIRVTREDSGRRTYRLFPGTDISAFERFGLQPGDEVVGINGLNLNEIDALSNLYDQLGDAPHMTLTLRRDEQTRVALYSFGH